MDPFRRDEKSKEFAARDPQEGLGRVHLELVCPHEVKYLSKVSQMIAFTVTLDGNVIDVALDGLPGELGENLVHCPLIGSTGVLQPKGHNCVAEYPKRYPEGGVPLVIRVHFDLIVPGEAIHEGHPLIAGGIVYHDIGNGQREPILRTCVVEVAEVDADAD